MKKIIVMIALMLMVFGGSAYGADIGVTLNGAEVVMDSFSGTPYLDPAGRVMVPLRAVLEKAGAHVEYDTVTRLATVTTVDTEVIVPIGQSFVVVNHVNKPNDAPAKIVNSRTYLPIRIVMESLGYKVSWDSVASKVIIVKPGIPAPPATPATTPSATVPALQPTVANAIGNTSINLYNGGMIARENQWLYFVNYNDDERLWRVDVTTGKSNVISARRAASINVVDGWAYYRQQTVSGSWDLHRTKGDGTSDEQMVTYDVQWLKVEGKTVYYYQTNPVGLYKRDVEGLFSTKILDSAMSCITLENGYLYYADEDENAISGSLKTWNVLRYKLDDMYRTEIRTLRTTEDKPLAAVYDGKLFYREYNDADALYVLDVQANSVKKLTGQRTLNVGVGTSGYYTIFPMFNNALHKVESDGSGIKKIGNEWQQAYYFDPSIQVSGDYVFYIDKPGSTNYELIRVDARTATSKMIEKPEDLIEN